MNNPFLRVFLLLWGIQSTMMVAKATCTASYTRTKPGLTVTFTNTSTSSSGSAANLYYFWDFGDGTTSTLKNPVKTFTSPGVKNIQLSVYDSAINCSAINTDTIIVTPVSNNYCSAWFKTSVSALSVTFTSSTSVDPNLKPTNYYWDFGDGTTSTLEHPVKTYTTPGPKVIKLSIYDSLTGCATSWTGDSIYLQSAGSKCQAYFSTGNYGWTYTLSNGSFNTNGDSTGLSYYWDFGDSTFSTAKNPSKSYTSPGIRTIKLWIKDTTQSCYAKYAEGAYVSGTALSCQAAFSRKITNGLTVKYSNFSVNKAGNTNGLQYSWDFGDGTSSTLKNPTKTFNQTGVKHVRLTIYDSLFNCSSIRIDTLNLTIGGNVCSAIYTPIADGLTVSFLNSSVNAMSVQLGLSYLWDFGDSTTSTLKNPVKTFASRGSKTITLTIMDSANNCKSSRSSSFVFCPKTASFKHTQSGLTVSFTNTSLDANNLPAQKDFYWSLGDGTYSSRKNVVKTYDTAGTKFIWLMYIDTMDNCTQFIHDTLHLTPPDYSTCKASFLTLPDTIQPFNFTILNTSIVSPNSTFTWDFGDGTTSTSITPSHSYASFGLYRVCLSIADSSCSSMFCDSVGMDSTGMLLKAGAFGFTTVDSTKLTVTTGLLKQDKMFVDAVSVYPNPASDILNITYHTTHKGEVSLEILDITGNKIQRHNLTCQPGENTEAISVEELKPSIYFIRISTSAGQKMIKFSKY